MKNKLLNKLIRDKLISIVETEEIPTARVIFQNQQFIIKINPHVMEKEQVIMHEIGHIARGDFLTYYESDESLDKDIFNISADLIINSVIDLKTVHIGDYEYILVHEEPFYELYPDAPSWKHGWRAIYEYLTQGHSQVSENFEEFDEIKISKEDIEEAKKVAKKIRKAIIEEDPSLAKALLGDQIQSAINRTRKDNPSLEDLVIEAKPDPYMIRLAKEILNVAGEGTGYGYKRSYRRTRGIGGAYLPTHLNLPSYSVLMIVDTSGSYIGIAMEQVLPAIEYLRKKGINTDLMVFDEEARWVHGRKFSTELTTYFNPVIQTLRSSGKTYDLIVFISDYHFFDFPSDRKQVRKALSKFAPKVITLDWREVK